MRGFAHNASRVPLGPRPRTKCLTSCTWAASIEARPVPDAPPRAPLPLGSLFPAHLRQSPPHGGQLLALRVRLGQFLAGCDSLIETLRPGKRPAALLLVECHLGLPLLSWTARYRGRLHRKPGAIEAAKRRGWGSVHRGAVVEHAPRINFWKMTILPGSKKWHRTVMHPAPGRTQLRV
jgi:hypothetical protein